MNRDILSRDILSTEKFDNEIISLIRSNQSPGIIREKLDDYHENDIARILEDLEPKDRKKLYNIADPEMLGGIFEYLEEDDAAGFLDEMDIKKACDVVSWLEADTAVEILKNINREKRKLIIDSLDPETRNSINLIAAYDDDEIGSRMTTNLIVITKDLDIKQAMRELVRQAEENDNISTIFVTDDKKVFYGAIDLKDLIIARKDNKLEDLVVTAFPYVYADEDIDDCLEKLKEYSEDSVPVLDDSNRLLGVITSQNIIEVVDDELSEDYVKLAGLIAEEDLNEPLGLSLKKRLPWLVILLFLGLGVSCVVGIFEGVVAKLTLIMAFQSLILDMSGNVGTQSLAVTIRVLVDEQLTAGDKLRLVFKEMRVGLCNGLLLGVLSFFAIGLYLHIFAGKEWLFSMLVSGCVGGALLLAMLISSVVGTLIPMFFKKINVDPAVASGPLITTVNDLVAVVTYYGMSFLLLIQAFHLA